MTHPTSTAITKHEDAIRWIYDRINYESVRPHSSSSHFRLDRVEHLLSLIGSPQERIPVVHIAGTKGKGSTAALLDSILSVSGVRAGLFTSPHIHQFEERMRVGGRMPSPLELANLVSGLRAALEFADETIIEDGPTYFEVATLLAWMFFDQNDVDVAILETGLGGRLDCTNVCEPELTVITSIGLDHTEILGDTLEQIAFEKAGILKEGVPLLTWALQPGVLAVTNSRAQELGCPVYTGARDIRISESSSEPDRFTIETPWNTWSNLKTSLLGEHQRRNAALAVAAADYLLSNSSTQLFDGVNQAAVLKGLCDVKWPLRFDVCSTAPTIILDAAHNPDSISAFLATLSTFCQSQHPLVLVFASSGDKDARGMLQQLSEVFEHVILTRFETNPRAISVDELQSFLPDGVCHDRIHCTASPRLALEKAIALAGEEGIICVTGSIFIAAEISQMIDGQSETEKDE